MSGPQSPLDIAFPPAISSNQVNTTSVVVADSSSSELAGGLDMGRGYIGVPVDAHSQGCYPHDMSLNVGVQGNVPMLPDLHYVSYWPQFRPSACRTDCLLDVNRRRYNISSYGLHCPRRPRRELELTSPSQQTHARIITLLHPHYLQT